MGKKLYRSQDRKMIAGICGGLGEYLNVDANLVRLIFVALGLFSAIFPMVIFYIIAWVIVPFPEKSD